MVTSESSRKELTHLENEACSTKIMEFMSQRVPVVASRTEGRRLLFRRRGCSFLSLR
jgi:hypothetical protein